MGICPAAYAQTAYDSHKYAVRTAEHGNLFYAKITMEKNNELYILLLYGNCFVILLLFKKNFVVSFPEAVKLRVTLHWRSYTDSGLLI